MNGLIEKKVKNHVMMTHHHRGTATSHPTQKKKPRKGKTGPNR